MCSSCKHEQDLIFVPRPHPWVVLCRNTHCASCSVFRCICKNPDWRGSLQQVLLSVEVDCHRDGLFMVLVQMWWHPPGCLHCVSSGLRCYSQNLVLWDLRSSTIKGIFVAGVLVVLVMASVGEGNRVAPFWGEILILYITRDFSILLLWDLSC